MDSGTPLLSDLGLDLDFGAVRELMIKLAAAIETVSRSSSHRLRLPWSRATDEPHAAGNIKTALEEKRLNIDVVLADVAAGKRGSIIETSRSLGLDPDLIWTLAQNALKPAMRAWRRQLTPLAEGISWNKGTCFVCGAAATLAEMQGNHLERHLRCGQCGADWQFPRLRCMYCGNEDHRSLKSLFTGTHSETTRLDACDICHGYIKVITSFDPTSAEMLTVEDLATLHLDQIAKSRGYQHGSV